MEQSFQSDVQRIVAEAMGHYAVPGMAVGAVRGDQPLQSVILGTDAAGRALDGDSLFPVASLTKLATALCILRLTAAGRIDLDEPLARALPSAAAAQPGVTIRRLLCHTSGLPLDLGPSVATYSAALDWPALLRGCLNTPLQYPPGTRVQYSNVGYGLLAGVVERLQNQAYRDVLSSLVLGPAAIEAYLGVETPRPSVVLADIRSGFVGTDLEPFNTPFWRQLALPWGGLITTLSGALRLVRVYRDTVAGFLPSSLLAEAISNQTDDLAGGFVPPLIWPRAWWGLGPDLRDTKVPHWTPSEASPGTFGHSGESGALAYCDPTVDVTWAILGARTAYNGWLLRSGPPIGAAILQSARLGA